MGRILSTAGSSASIILAGVLMFGSAARAQSALAPTATFNVPATADPWLAGMANGTTASCETGVCDYAPAQSPVLVTGIPIVPGSTLTFSATGLASYGPNHPMAGPDGGLDSSGNVAPVQHDDGAQNGISDILTNLSSLIGVFLGPNSPDTTTPPAIGGFRPQPLLQQVFTIGSSRTVVVPPGATRLYLAVMDGYEWSNNPGSFSATVSVVPSVVSLNPAAGSGTSQFTTFQFADAAGYKALSVVNILINSALDARQSCYIAYDVPDNVLYLVQDNGSALSPGLVLNGSSSAGNSQCAVLGSGSSASGSGNVLTLTLNMIFSASFAGNKVVYMAARDASANSGWQTMGVRNVPGTPPSFPTPDAMTPAAGTASSSMLTLTYEDASSASNLQTMWALVNTSLDGRSACYISYYAPANQLLLIPDNGSVEQPLNMVLTGKNSIANSQCSISSSGSSVVQNGAKTILNLNVSFSPSFAGSKIAWMATQTKGGAQTSSWQSLGTWSIPGG